MGLLDAPPPAYAGPRLTTWHRKVTAEVSDTSILVLGDSTGTENPTTRWPRLLADKVAARFPRHTVVYRPWDDTTKTYPAGSAVTVQTGASGRSITVWNCSISGQVIGYSYSNFTAITTGVSADVIIFNYGHNSPQDPPNYRALTHQAVNEYTSLYPNAAIVLTAQNPRDPTDPVYAADEAKQQANYEYAVAEGFGIVDVSADYRAYGDFNADLLADGLHPTATGSARWVGLVWDAIQPRAKRTSVATPAARAQRVWVPAKAFEAADGSPTYGTTFGLSGWALDADVEESLVVVVDYPSDWVLVNVDILFTTATAPSSSARTVTVQSSHMYVSNRAATGISTTLGTWTANAAGVASAPASTTANRQSIVTASNRAAYSGRPLGLKIARKAADASDTLPQDMIVLGAMIQRMY